MRKGLKEDIEFEEESEPEEPEHEENGGDSATEYDSDNMLKDSEEESEKDENKKVLAKTQKSNKNLN